MRSSNSRLTRRRLWIGILLTFSVISINFSVQSQQLDSKNLKFKNTIYFETIGATGLGGSVNYKRSYWTGEKTSFNASIGFGGIIYSLDNEPDFVIPFSLTFVHGIRKGFEWGAGLSYLPREVILAPNIVMGYRFQNKKVFVWVGLVTLVFLEYYPESIYNGHSYWSFAGVIPAPGFRIGKSF